MIALATLAIDAAIEAVEEVVCLDKEGGTALAVDVAGKLMLVLLA